jgi:thiaminase/transcriptional activator TenA
MKGSERLLDAVGEIWESYNRHPFVMGIQDGTLDREKFRYYILQDTLYLEDYARVFALGASKAKSMETSNLFAGYILAMNAEQDLHAGYLAKFGVTAGEIAGTSRALDNQSYTSYMLRVAYEGDETEILAAILSCAYSYEVVAGKILKNNPSAGDDPFYGEWIRGYVSEGYSAENRRLLETFDRLSEGCGEEKMRRLTEIFTLCSRYELAFWDMAWNKSN